MIGFISNLFGRSELSQLQEQTALAEARAQLARSRVEAHMLESWWPASYTGTAHGDLVDPLDRFRVGDDFWLPPAASELQRRDGGNYPFFQNESELWQLQALIRLLVETSPLAKGILKQLTNFVIGEGYTYRATPEDGREPEEQLVTEVQAVIDEFLDLNDWCELEQELFRRSRRDGEYFLRYFGQDDGSTVVRAVEPEHVRQPHDTEMREWSFGIKTDLDDVQEVKEYHVQPYQDQEGELVDPEDIDHVKVNVDRGIKRGLSDFYCARSSLDEVRKLLRNLSIGGAIQAAITGVWEYETAGASSVSAHVSAIRDTGRQYPTNPITGKTTNYQKFEPGDFIHTPKGKKFLPPPMASQNSPNHIAIVQAVLRAVGAAWCMPEYMISGDASNANYSSTLVSGSPFVREVKTAQAFYKRRFLATIWRILWYAAESGRFPGYRYEAIETLIAVQCEAPMPEIANRFEEAQVKEIEHRNRVVSTQTWRQQSGYDNDQEVINLAEEPPVVPSVIPGQGGPGPFPFPGLRTG